MARKFIFGGSYSSAVPLLLDLYPSTQGQYYMHKVSSTYVGACIRVRRSSDSSEMNIGFVGNDLDTVSLLAFVGAGDGFVTTWFSQSGYFDVTQPVLANQPAIVLAGVLQTLNGKPCLKFDGVNDFLSGGTLANNTNQNMFATGIGELTSNNRPLFAKAGAVFIDNRWFLTRGTTTSVHINNVQQTIGNQSSAKLFSFGAFYVPSVKQKMNTYLNNTQVATSNIGVLAGNNFRFLIGATGNSTDTGQGIYSNGKIQCFGFWSGQDNESNVSPINIIINGYYAIY